MKVLKYICDENVIYMLKQGQITEGNPRKEVNLAYQKLGEKREIEYANLDEMVEI